MNQTMLTDKYQLAMNASYFQNKNDGIATFDLFIRELPADWGYFIAGGIEEAINYITSIEFTEDDLDYLRKEWFDEEYLEFLRTFKFEGNVWAVKEGTIVFPNQPIIRVTAKRTQAQFLETTLLNIVNFSTMIMSKASRVVNVAKPALVADFGLRRAQGVDAALKASRACYIAGCFATSNIMAGKNYDIPVFGTMAHSFVMSYENEIDSFRDFVKTFPINTTLLIDTYDTRQGARNAAVVAHELENEGYRLGAVRIDSGELVYDARDVRKILDEEGLDYVRITLSSDLNEYKIAELAKDGIATAYGVGTEMVTAKPVAAIPGVYKLVDDDVLGPRIKLSPGKKTLPGKKQLFRIYDHGKMSHDIICVDGEEVSESNAVELLELTIKNGNRIRSEQPTAEIREYTMRQVETLPNSLKLARVNFDYPILYSDGLEELIESLISRYGEE